MSDHAHTLRRLADEAYKSFKQAQTVSEAGRLLRLRRHLINAANELDRLTELVRVCSMQTDPDWAASLAKEGLR